MVNNRNNNFIVINYVNEINKTLNKTVLEINNIRKTNSISYDFINQIVPYQKFVLQTTEYTLRYTKNRKILSATQNICTKYPEIIDDMKKIKIISQKFKNCCECVTKYHDDFHRVTQHTFSEMKKINQKQNINYYFLKLLGIYFSSESKILENFLQYRICPQLRLITEYMLCLNNQNCLKHSFSL